MEETTGVTPSRHQVYEQIRLNEIARGTSEDEAARIAADTVDKVMAQAKGEQERA
jgi:hypothetical protein